MTKPVRIILSVFIVSLAVFFTGSNLIALVSGYMADDQSMMAIARDQFCVPRIQTTDDLTNKKLIVLRLDDVQAYSWRGISMQMIRDAYKFNAPIVAGVIPKWLEEDRVLVRFLKRESCNIEIALHGWDHFGTGMNTLHIPYATEFWDIDYERARERIEMWKKVLEPLSNRPITTFIPPFNIASADAIRAISDAWIQIYSAIGTGAYDYHSTTYNFDKKRIVPVDELIENCEDAFEKYKLCVIMMHPQDYANSQKTLDETLYNNYYLGMLERFSELGVVFVTFDDLVKNRIHAQ